ncbi:alpha-taxilin-like [Daphnia carinata]|uniref:alpha-taxilin-like n=1 Tax=Daphnia carinata TaxID=120202 RepID=UPI00257DD621|nr:alpha-taxilin-like [Daphnia carinata]
MDKYQSWQTTEYNNKKVSNETEAENLQEKSPLGNTKDNQCFGDVSFDSTNTVVNKGKITEQTSQLTAEMFSLEDVQHLQKLNRDLRAQNIKKTMDYIKLEQEYHFMKDEIMKVKREDRMRRQETRSLLKIALEEISSQQKCPARYSDAQADHLADQKCCQHSLAGLAERNRILKELSELTRKYDDLQRMEVQGRRRLALYEEKYQYFENVIHNSFVYLENLRTKLNASIGKTNCLQSEIAVWKNRCREYERAPNKVYGNHKLPASADSSPSRSSTTANVFHHQRH